MKYEKKVSICMMIKDEEENLPRCLESLKPIIDSSMGELIIVDTGSEDNSVAIAKKYTDKVYYHPWNNDFSEMRNISISYAKGEWIWIMDADEEIENPNEMIKLFKKDLSKYNTLIVNLKNYTGNKIHNDDNDFNVSVLNRGFRNGKDFKYEGKIHEQPINKHPYLTTNIEIGHYGYVWTNVEFRNKKFERTTKILRAELENDPNNIYLQFQLAVSCSVVNYENGLVEMRKAYELIKKLTFKEKAKYIYVYGIYAKIAHANKKFIEIIDLCKEGLSIAKDYIDLWYYLAISSVAIGAEEEGLVNFKKYLNCKENFNNTEISKDPSFTFYTLGDNSVQSALYNIAVIYINRKEYDKALEYLEKMDASDLKSKIIARMISEEGFFKLLPHYLEELKYKEDILLDFIDIVENVKYTLEKKVEISKEFIKFYNLSKRDKDKYYLLNNIRVKMDRGEWLDLQEERDVLNLSFDELPRYYGDIVAYILKYNLDINIFTTIGKPEVVDKFGRYIDSYYDDTHNVIANYLNMNDKSENIAVLRNWILLARVPLFDEKLDYVNYVELFNKYIDRGIQYIKVIYNPDILNDDYIYDINSDEHKFFTYMMLAKDANNKNDIINYVQYLRKALKVYPMKNGIQILLDEIKQKENERLVKDNTKSEFDSYKEIVKKNINLLIDTKRIADAKALIDEYLRIVPDDLEVINLSLKVSMMFS